MPEVNTWRAFEENISQAVIMEFVEQWEAHGFRFGCVTIDEGWTSRAAAFGDWIPDKKRFPDLRGLVDWLHAKGIRVRLWVAPLAVNDGAQLMKSPLAKHLLLGANNKPIRQLGRHACMLDTRVAAVQRHVAATFKRLTRDYDVDGYKVDFPLLKSEDHEVCYLHDNLPINARQQIQRQMFQAIRTGCDSVKPGIRLECYPFVHCAEFIDDVFWSDLIGDARTQAAHAKLNVTLGQLARQHGWVTWPEMIWGLGSNTPAGNPHWEHTYLEWMATDINYERKLELSFPPFAYTNCAQIRTLNNLYATGGSTYKVAHAGNISFDLFQLQQDGIQLSLANRFLVAPHEEGEVRFVVPPSCGKPSQWEIVDLLGNDRVRWQERDEEWVDGILWHCLRFNAHPGKVYEIRARL